MASNKTITYQDAGVSIDEADRAVALIREHARGTFTRGVLTDIGSFGGGFQLSGWKNPVLVSSADGVGTKLKIAFMSGRHNTIGEDLVNHCVNDIAVQGAVPLFFLDYFAVGKLDAAVAGQVVEGIARGCKNNGCALVGGETAEMPGLYQEGEYDLAGFIVGAVERKQMLTGAGIKPSDVLIGLPSNGLHTNGYSLARKLLFDNAGRKLDDALADELLRVHRSYLKPIRALIDERMLKGAAHITGGGITDNTPRILPKGLAARVDVSTWTIPEFFEELRVIGNLDLADYRRTFNLGVGMILVVAKRNLGKARALLSGMGEACFHMGEVVESPGPRVEYVGGEA
ncbi:MAG TPA: phosphoribosylformylglycinamidine cyclo-ligase [Bryobacteraceae bacterium]|nr:phosphoribosylformylglycinamidine cyclo-ligase [Bryobacteraceae bacterium]